MIGSLDVLDNIRLNFNEGGLHFLNVTLALIMFGVALEIKLSNFKKIVHNPKPVLVGLLSQYIVMPAVSFLCVLLLHPSPSVALGMILVAACPGGNISNFLSLMAKGNIELSVSLTAIITIAAVFFTPFNFAFYGNLYSEAAHIMMPISIDPWEMVRAVVLLLGIPLILGMLFAWRFPDLTKRISKPMKIFSLVVFAGFIVVALYANIQYFLKYIHLIILIVFVQNSMAFLSGYLTARSFKLARNDVKTISIESGIHNTGLGLVLIFNPRLFNGLGGMAFIAAWWGIWHIVAGMGVAWFYSRKNNRH
jgi:Predicted Na+-dependent transporter